MRRSNDGHEHPPAEYPTPEDIPRLFERYRTAPVEPPLAPRPERWADRAEDTERVPTLVGG
jgi:hypothetical protein